VGLTDPPATPVHGLGSPPGPIAPGDSLGVAGRKAMWIHAERMLRLEAEVRDPANADELRRYRVATRRLRAALRLFGKAYPGRKVAALRAGLGDLGRAAGAARDVDVRVAGLDRWASEGGDARITAVAPLRRSWIAARDAAATDLLRRLDSRRHKRLLDDLMTFVGGEGRVTAAGGRSIRDSAASRLWRAFEVLRDLGGDLSAADLVALHDVRIAAKRLRYALEFLGDVLPDDRLRLVERLVALQDHLGALNDAALAAEAARAFRAAESAALNPDELAAIEAYAADREQEVERLRHDVDAVWRPIAVPAFARRLARAVVID
jgi:CHAD domain-containing protein